jgi:hypothetical protein
MNGNNLTSDGGNNLTSDGEASPGYGLALTVRDGDLADSGALQRGSGAHHLRGQPRRLF